jgi:hypothetical protein
MTIREVLNKRKRIAAIISYIGLALFITIGVLSTRDEKLAALIPIAMLPLMGAMVYMLWLVRCPRCRGWIAPIIGYGGSPFSISRKFRFCPVCGVSLDDQSDATSKA